MLCAATLAVSASVGLWALYAPPHGSASADVAAFAEPGPALTPAPAAIAPLRQHAMLDPAFSGGAAPLTFAHSAPLRSHFEPQRAPLVVAGAPSKTDALRPSEVDTDTAPTAAEATTLASAEPQVVPPVPRVSELVGDVPLPTPRPRFETPEAAAAAPVAPALAAPHRLAGPVDAPAGSPAPAAPAAPGFFEKMFGKPQTPPAGGNTALAYAAPQDSVIGNLFGGRAPATASPDGYTAIYDISAHTVYLPDGTQLEAHSGLGEAFDSPNHVHMRMRGATPPNLYELTQREALFHGVRALRLTPIGSGETYGRGGLLAHTYMLRGGTGESNGCVVFRNYAAFLRAYDNGQIKRLQVVARRT